MKANTRMHEHTAAGRISVHTLNGHIRLHLPERVVDLPAGHLLALDQCVPHDVEAAEDSAFLLTLSWPPETKIVEAKARGRRLPAINGNSGKSLVRVVAVLSGVLALTANTALGRCDRRTRSWSR